MSLERGARIARYEILDLPGRGGMGEVYRATDTKLNRDVVLGTLICIRMDNASPS
jgi:serine/threonine protein kinase